MDESTGGCAACAQGGRSGFRRPFTMAFQPIADARARRVFAHEALVRGPCGEGAGTILALVTEERRGASARRCSRSG